MLKRVRGISLSLLRSSGVFEALSHSPWRQRRLLILCYHGISLEDEHEWRPATYMTAAWLEKRLELLKRGGYTVLPLAESLRRLNDKTLPPASVAITFDDGGYDFYRQAYPLLKSYSFPVTVYQTTYYCTYQRPIFNLICSYMLWKRRGSVLQPDRILGLTRTMDLRTEAGRQAVVSELMSLANYNRLSGEEKDKKAQELANFLGVDYGELLRKRVFQLMNPKEIAELSAEGVDFQLHTHRHRTPSEQALFRREIRDNRVCIQQITGRTPEHFCYPLGVYKREFLPWLEEEGVRSATTCDPALASSNSDAHLLPRFVDTSLRSVIEFESWLCGAGHLLALGRGLSL